MATLITTRSASALAPTTGSEVNKGSALTHNEVDQNFTNLKADKADLASPTFTGVPNSTTPGATDSTTKIATTAFVATTFAKKAGDTLTSATLTSAALTDAALNTTVTGTAVKDEDDMVSDSSTVLATQQSIKAYVDTLRSYVDATNMPRVSTRVCLWEGSNGTVANGIFSAPSIDRQQYTIIPSTHFSLSSGTFLKIDLEWQCVSAEDDIVVGDVLPHNYTQHDSNEASWPIWHDNDGDFSNSAMRVEFNVGDYGNDNAIFHLWTRPGGSSADAWYQKINFALYARIYYTL